MGIPPQHEDSKPLPVKNTFVHFDAGAEGNRRPLRKNNTDPASPRYHNNVLSPAARVTLTPVRAEEDEGPEERLEQKLEEEPEEPDEEEEPQPGLDVGATPEHSPRNSAGGAEPPTAQTVLSVTGTVPRTPITLLERLGFDSDPIPGFPCGPAATPAPQGIRQPTSPSTPPRALRPPAAAATAWTPEKMLAPVAAASPPTAAICRSHATPPSGPSVVLDGDGIFFTFTIRRDDNVSLGLNVSQSTDGKALLVHSVRPGGAIDAWNKQCITADNGCGKHVMPADKVVSVNGRTDCSGMLLEIKDNLLLKLVVVRGAGNSALDVPFSS
mmetsp:Transcript_109262/g.308233  ORF Transcript_109262/g.308233 Transcript_109262/m.308233 type:complete len:326 (+) Transcript_109262:125-1102(+)